MCDNHDRITWKICKVNLKENSRWKQNKTRSSGRINQQNWKSWRMDVRWINLCIENWNPFFLYLYNTYVLWIHIVTKVTYFSDLYLRCANQSEIPLDLRQEQGSSPRTERTIVTRCNDIFFPVFVFLMLWFIFRNDNKEDLKTQ